MHFPQQQGFHRLDLAVTLGVLGLVALALLPVPARSSLVTKTFLCLNNHRQLVNAWRMYADDNSDRLVFASAGNSLELEQYAWAGYLSDFNPANRANWDIHYDLTKRPLWPYSGKNASIYRCPADPGFLLVSGTVRARVRSVAMNIYLGGFGGSTGGWQALEYYRIYLKSSEFGAQSGPGGKIFVFTDLRSDEPGWSGFITDMTGYSANPAAFSLWDLPGRAHDGGSVFSFVDGSCAPRQWLDSRTTPPPGKSSAVSSWPYPSPHNPDVAWLQDHATRKK